MPLLDRTAPVTVAIVLALAPLTVRGLAVDSVGGGHLLGRCPTTNGRDHVIGHNLRIAPAPVTFALALGEIGTTLGMTSRGFLIVTDHVGSVRNSLLTWEVVVTVGGQAISLVVLVTPRCPADDLLPPLTVRSQRREDGEPDVSGRRVWRR